jgi:hypothetical protein
MQCDSAEKGLMMFRAVMFTLQLPEPQVAAREAELDTLTASVNPVRLKNNPVPLPEEVIRSLYNKILP